MVIIVSAFHKLFLRSFLDLFWRIAVENEKVLNSGNRQIVEPRNNIIGE